VTAAWLQEQYDLIRGLRFHLEKCLGDEDPNAERPAYLTPHPSRVSGSSDASRVRGVDRHE
jgi:hypothetical protein